jgi:hypothetical protein
MNDQFRRAIALAGARIDGRHAEANRLAMLELIVQQAILRLSWRVEIHDVAVDDQPAARRLPRHVGGGEHGDEHQRKTAYQFFHRDKVTKSLSSVQHQLAAGHEAYRTAWRSALGPFLHRQRRDDAAFLAVFIVINVHDRSFAAFRQIDDAAQAEVAIDGDDADLPTGGVDQTITEVRHALSFLLSFTER